YISNLGISIPEIMSRMIHIGVRWNPDSILLIDKIGYFGLLMICIVMGILSKKFSLLEDKKPVLHLTNYVILLQMISLPVGNFIFTSSANKLIVMLLIIYWIWRLFI